MPEIIHLTINGYERAVRGDPARSLLSVLREDLDLTGTKYGCGEGQCGSCTVLLDGAPTPSCVIRAGNAVGRQITTIEGLGQEGALHPLQQAFLEEDALQCGYCTPGMIISGAALLQKHPDPTREQIVSGMEGNVCRCCVYPQIIAAIRRAATQGKEAR